MFSSDVRMDKYLTHVTIFDGSFPRGSEAFFLLAFFNGKFMF